MEKDEKQQTNFADCYVLTSTRTAAFINSFLDTFLPNRQAYSKFFEVPQFAENPTQIFTDPNDIMAYLENNASESYGIYWYNTDSSNLQGAMCLFYEDGSLVLGLCCQTHYPDTSIEEGYTKNVMKFGNSDKACILYEQPAPRSLPEFLSKPVFIRKRD